MQFFRRHHHHQLFLRWINDAIVVNNFRRLPVVHRSNPVVPLRYPALLLCDDSFDRTAKVQCFVGDDVPRSANNTIPAGWEISRLSSFVLTAAILEIHLRATFPTLIQIHPLIMQHVCSDHVTMRPSLGLYVLNVHPDISLSPSALFFPGGVQILTSTWIPCSIERVHVL